MYVMLDEFHQPPSPDSIRPTPSPPGCRRRTLRTTVPGSVGQRLRGAAGRRPGHRRRLQDRGRGPRRHRLGTNSKRLADDRRSPSGRRRTRSFATSSPASAPTRPGSTWTSTATRRKTMGVSMAEHLQHAAGLPRLALRQRLQPLRPHLAGERPGRRQLPQAGRGPQASFKVRNDAGEMVPLGALRLRPGRHRPGDDPALQPVSGRARSTRRPPPGVSSGQAIARDGAARRATICRRRCAPSGPSWRYFSSRPATRPCCVFLLAVVLVFLVLAAQYESWSLPLAVILVVPMCLLVLDRRRATPPAWTSTSSRRSASSCWSAWRARTRS